MKKSTTTVFSAGVLSATMPNGMAYILNNEVGSGGEEVGGIHTTTNEPLQVRQSFMEAERRQVPSAAPVQAAGGPQPQQGFSDEEMDQRIKNLENSSFEVIADNTPKGPKVSHGLEEAVAFERIDSFVPGLPTSFERIESVEAAQQPNESEGKAEDPTASAPPALPEGYHQSETIPISMTKEPTTTREYQAIRNVKIPDGARPGETVRGVFADGPRAGTEFPFSWTVPEGAEPGETIPISITTPINPTAGPTTHNSQQEPEHPNQTVSPGPVNNPAAEEKENIPVKENIPETAKVKEYIPSAPPASDTLHTQQALQLAPYNERGAQPPQLGIQDSNGMHSDGSVLTAIASGMARAHADGKTVAQLRNTEVEVDVGEPGGPRKISGLNYSNVLKTEGTTVGNLKQQLAEILDENVDNFTLIPLDTDRTIRGDDQRLLELKTEKFKTGPNRRKFADKKCLELFQPYSYINHELQKEYDNFTKEDRPGWYWGVSRWWEGWTNKEVRLLDHQYERLSVRIRVQRSANCEAPPDLARQKKFFIHSLLFPLSVLCLEKLLITTRQANFRLVVKRDHQVSLLRVEMFEGENVTAGNRHSDMVSVVSFSVLRPSECGVVTKFCSWEVVLQKSLSFVRKQSRKVGRFFRPMGWGGNVSDVEGLLKNFVDVTQQSQRSYPVVFRPKLYFGWCYVSLANHKLFRFRKGTQHRKRKF